MNKHQLTALAAVALLALGSRSALAQPPQSSSVTRGATAMTSSLPTRASYGADNLINQSGLDTPYVNGSTPFEQYTATARHFSSTTPADDFSNNWLGDTTRASGLLNFDLGATYTIDGMAWFNLASSVSARVTGLAVYADDDNDAVNGKGTLLFTSGNVWFGAAVGTSGTSVAANVFMFTQSADTRYLTVELLSNSRNNNAIGAGEVVFSQATAPVPEPATYALMLAGLGAVGFMARRRA